MLLMTFATKSLSSVSVVATRVAARGFTPIVALVKALIHRREVLRLGELDERGLKDIGLVRSDLDGALAVSWLSDPSVILAERSSTRSGVAAKRREAGLQQPVNTTPAAKAQPVVAARTSASASKASASKPLVSRAKAVNSVACSA
jgi:uncharacterized protein YjiS (DUF1127 family)